MRYIWNLSFIVGSVLIVLACGSSGEVNRPEDRVGSEPAVNVTVSSPTPEDSVGPEKTVAVVDVPQLADQPAAGFERVFGEPVKVTEITDNPRLMPGEYREYKVAGHPKNLSVRFYKNRAKRFNLLLGTPEKSSQAALQKIFKIDVGRMRPVKTDSLSETWAGMFGGINYKTAYAKRSGAGGDFVMLHAEIE
jgi:hypothetical protein